MHLRQKFAAQTDLGMCASKRLVQRDHSIQHETPPGRELVKLAAQPAFQVLENHGNKSDISDFVPNESITHKLWPQRAQVHHASTADEWADEANHKINRMIRRQNTEVPDSRPEWVPRRERFALLQIIIMSEDRK